MDLFDIVDNDKSVGFGAAVNNWQWQVLEMD